MTVILARTALLPDGWARNVSVHIGADGRISAGNWSLFTARQVVQELGGEIQVVSEPVLHASERV